MLGTQVNKDLNLDSIHSFLPLQTSWGKQQFSDGLIDCKANRHILKERQMPLLAMRIASNERCLLYTSPSPRD